MQDRTGTEAGPGPVQGPEPGPEHEAVSIPLAARTLGISERAVRKRIAAGTLAAEPFGRSYKVWLPSEVPEPGPVLTGASSGPHGPGAEPGPEPIEARFRTDEPPQVALVPLHTMVEELRGLANELGEMARRNEALAVEVGTLRERTAAQQETIAELRAQLEQRTASVDATQDAPAAPGAPTAGKPSTDTPTPSAGLWQRLRAALGVR